MIQRGFREFVVDLQDCEQMDSTFMGTLAGVALRLRELGHGSLRATNVNERNTDLLSSLGLDQLFTVEPIGSVPEIEPQPDDETLRVAEPKALEAEAQKQAVLEAHEALVEADRANAVKFKDVLEFLRNELNAQDSSDKEG